MRRKNSLTLSRVTDRPFHRSTRIQPQCVVLIASHRSELRTRFKKALIPMFATHLAADRGQLERAIARFKPTILLVDVSLPGLNEIKGIVEMNRLNPATRIVALAASPNEEEQILALRNGIKGYCTSDLDPVLITRAVEIVRKGEIWTDRQIIQRLIDKLAILYSKKQKRAAKKMDPLTARQREIALLVAKGATNKEIGTLLRITESAVKSHLSAMFRKLGISNRLALALFVRERDPQFATKV